MTVSYSDRLTTYYKDPQWRGVLQGPTVVTGSARNTSCGDDIQLFCDIQKGVVHAARYTGQGCVLSQAAAALLCDHVTGKAVQELVRLSGDDMLALVGIPLGPVRARCVLLAWQALVRIT